jgi:hypothetical protein
MEGRSGRKEPVGGAGKTYRLRGPLWVHQQPIEGASELPSTALRSKGGRSSGVGGNPVVLRRATEGQSLAQDRTSTELLEQRLGVLQVGGVEAFGLALECAALLQPRPA